jgi:hypothetical protein
MQCKDIPDKPILEFLKSLEGQWANWCWENEKNVALAMPKGVPPKLVLAKMRMLIRRRLVDGCGCGCRGDFVLTEKGLAYLEKQSVTDVTARNEE